MRLAIGNKYDNPIIADRDKYQNKPYRRTSRLAL